MKVRFPCPAAALALLASDLRQYGAYVHFEDGERSGSVHTLAGSLRFSHDGECLCVEVVRDLGHFSKPMLIGGMRQLIEEAAERL